MGGQDSSSTCCSLDPGAKENGRVPSAKHLKPARPSSLSQEGVGEGIIGSGPWFEVSSFWPPDPSSPAACWNA